ncbi:MAG: hypothetical protein ACI3YT_06305 [Prevotella sp.]
MGIREFGEFYGGLVHLNYMMGMWRISPREINCPSPPILAVRAIVIVTSGGMHLRIGEHDHIMASPSYADFSGSGTSLRLMSSSSDADGYVFLFSSEYVVSLFKNHPPFPRSYVSHIQSHPVCRLTPDAASVLAGACCSLMHTLCDHGNIHRRQIIDSKTTILYLEIANFTKFFKRMTSLTPLQYRNR